MKNLALQESQYSPARKLRLQVNEAVVPRVIGYLRVSTGIQDLENQKLGILELSNGNGWKVEFVEEKVSGNVSYKNRALGEVIQHLSRGDVLIVSELSRLGRSMLEIMTLIGQLLEKGVHIHAVKGNYRLDTSLQSKILTMVLCMASEIERDLISQRTREALARKKAEGVKLGRPKGVPGKSKLDDKADEIKNYLQKGLNVTALSKIYGCAWSTMKDFIRKKVTF
jgi:DNA invertase Pin-like site-specific DNA recombinase